MIADLNEVSILIEGLDHPECVAVHPDGSVWAGGEAGQVYRISPDGKTKEEIGSTGGFILGIAFSPDLSWLALCDLKNKCIWKLDLDNYSLVKFSEGTPIEKINIPNYPVFDNEGNLYVTESGEFRKVNGKIFKIDPNGITQVWHPGPFNFANGMAISKDQDCLFVVCTWLPGVERVGINNDGTAGEREVYATLPETCPDGVVIDSEGNLLVSCYAPNRIYQIKKNQEVRLFIDDWEGHTLSNPTNMAFGGPGFNTLYIANLGRWHIAQIQLTVMGLKLPCHR
ncbi:SMP-30/gluconolactonase/LRE family protein [Pararhodonellum marinum]|uniref:SMP-30/gluconolactonase/LRE family protein n=1 Tax=Pararhodonellum marinum TaxID=2755358 RepID=UPI00188DEDBC|nr:SMP-30/gluconolactonase/LRE family protein [Pararhodonellum marinum]